MGTLQVIGRNIQRSKWLQILLALGLIVAVYLYYSLGSSMKITAIRDNGSRSAHDHVASEKDSSLLSVSDKVVDVVPEIREVDVMITFTKAETNHNLQKKFRTTVKSLLRFCSVPVNLYILGDAGSEKIARAIVEEEAPDHKQKYKVNSKSNKPSRFKDSIIEYSS